MNQSEHLTDDLLIGAIDDELADSQAAAVRDHLSSCEECRHKHGRLRTLSTRLVSAVAAIPVQSEQSHRASLIAQMERVRKSEPATRKSQSLLWRFGWSMGVAATVAMGVMLTAHMTSVEKTGARASAQTASSGTFEIDGETFVALPYSNPDIPLNGPRIVEMQVPVSSLADAGVMFEPIMNQVSSGNRSVLADVLLGTDGQPLGVHVLESQ